MLNPAQWMMLEDAAGYCAAFLEFAFALFGVIIGAFALLAIIHYLAILSGRKIIKAFGERKIR